MEAAGGVSGGGDVASAASGPVPARPRRDADEEIAALRGLLSRERERALAAERGLGEMRQALRLSEQQNGRLRETLSFQIGNAIVRTRTPADLLRLPWRLFCAARDFRARMRPAPKAADALMSEDLRLADAALRRLRSGDLPAARQIVAQAAAQGDRVRAQFELALRLADSDPAAALEIAETAAAAEPGHPLAPRVLARLVENRADAAAGHLASSLLDRGQSPAPTLKAARNALAWIDLQGVAPPPAASPAAARDAIAVTLALTPLGDAAMRLRGHCAAIDAPRGRRVVRRLVNSAPALSLSVSPGEFLAAEAARISALIQSCGADSVHACGDPLAGLAALLAARRHGCHFACEFVEFRAIWAGPAGAPRFGPLERAGRRLAVRVAIAADVVVVRDARMARLAARVGVQPERIQTTRRRSGLKLVRKPGPRDPVGLLAAHLTPRAFEGVLASLAPRLAGETRLVVFGADSRERADLCRAAARKGLSAAVEFRDIPFEAPAAPFEKLAALLYFAPRGRAAAMARFAADLCLAPGMALSDDGTDAAAALGAGLAAAS